MPELNSSGKAVCHSEWKKTNGDGIPALGSNAYSCPCKNCKSILSRTADWTSMQKEKLVVDIRIGDRVLVHGQTPGVVRYVGDLDSDYTNDQVFVGVKLDDPVGEHDGVLRDKRFFKCPSMHGIIVPIEAIHVLVPRDGRTIHVKALDEKFYTSMPMLTNSATFGHPKIVNKTNNRAVSMGSVTSTPKKPTATSQLCACTNTQSSSDRSMPDSANTANATTSSSKKSVPTSADSLVVEDMNDDQQSDDFSSSSSASIEQQDKTTPSKTVTRPLSKCATTPFSLFSLKSSPTKVHCSKSHECRSLSSAHTRSGIASKLTITASKKPSNPSKVSSKAKSVASIKPTTSNKREVKVSSTENVDVKSDETLKVQSPTVSSNGVQKETLSDSVPVVPRLAFLPESESVLSDLTAEITPKPSYTGRLLSTLPNKEAMTPLSVSSQLKEVLEFEEHVQAWGGGIKGWTLAQTLQKLKDAQRKGAKEVIWQMNVEKLEKDKKDPRVQHIAALRNEILKVRKQREDIEAQITAQKRALNTSQLRLEIEDLEQKTKVVDKENDELVQQIKSHSLFDLVEGAVMIEYSSSTDTESGTEVTSEDGSSTEGEPSTEGEYGTEGSTDEAGETEEVESSASDV